MATNKFSFDTNISHYEVLGVSRSATSEDIKKAYKKLSLRFHPDKAGQQSTGNFQRLVDARDTLLNTIKRSEYDDENEDDIPTEAEGALLCGPRLSESFKQKFTEWTKELFIVQRTSLHKFPQEFQQMLQKFSNDFLQEQIRKSQPLAISYTKETSQQGLTKSWIDFPIENSVNHVMEGVTSTEENDLARLSKINSVYKRAIESGYRCSNPGRNNLEPIVDFSTSSKEDIQTLIELLSADEPETIATMNPSQLLGRLLRYVPRKRNDYLRNSNITSGIHVTQSGFFAMIRNMLIGIKCEGKFCESYRANRMQIYGFGSDLEVFLCHSCLEKVYREHAKEWINRAHSLIEGGKLEDLKAAFGCVQIAISLFKNINLTATGKKLLHHNYPELALPFALAAQQQASTTIEQVKANKFLSSVFKSLAAMHTDPNISWELLLGAQEAVLLAKKNANRLNDQVIDVPSLQQEVEEINHQLHISRTKKEPEEEKQIRHQYLEIERYWRSRNVTAMVNLIRLIQNENDKHSSIQEAFERFLHTMEPHVPKMLPDDRYSIIFFCGVLKLLKKRYAEGISDIEQVVWHSHSTEILKREAISILLSLLTIQPSIFTLQGLHTICTDSRSLLSGEKLSNDFVRELQLISLNEDEINPPFKQQWPELSVSGLNLRAHRKCEAAFIKQLQEKKWGLQDVGYAYIDYIQGCHHPAEIIVSLLHASMWFLKDLKEKERMQQCEKFAIKKLVFALLGSVYVLAHRNSHPGMQLYAGRSALAIALEMLKKTEDVAEPEDTKLISSLLHMVTYNSRFVPFWKFPSVPVSEAALLSIISAELHTEYLDQLKETDSKQRPMSEAELQYQLYENDLRYVRKTEDPESLHETAMKELLAEKGWNMSDVSTLMTSPLTLRDKDGWIIQQPKLGRKQQFAEVKGIIINIDDESPSIELVVVPADDSRGRMGTCSETDFKHVLSMVDEANGALFFSLEQPDDQKKFHPFQEFRYTSERIYNSDLLHTLFETDYLMKSFSVGSDISSKPPFDQRPNEEGLTKNLSKRLQEKLKPVSKRGATQNRAHRFWIQADDIDYSEDQSNGRIEIRLGEMDMKIRSHPLIPGEDGKLVDTSDEDDPDSPEAKFAADMTEVYNELGLHFPMFLRLRELAKLQVLGVFLRGLLQGMKEKSEGKVKVPTEVLQKIQSDALQRIKEQLKQGLNSTSSEIGVWPEAEDSSKVSSEVRRVLNELPYNVSASYSDVEPHVVSALQKKDASVLSQLEDALMSASNNKLTRYTLQKYVISWLCNRTYTNLDNLVDYVSSDATLPTEGDIRGPMEAMYKKRYSTFCNLVQKLSFPNQNPTANPCKWVPAALHKEEDGNHLSLCYGGVLIAPKVHERYVSRFPRHSRHVLITQTNLSNPTNGTIRTTNGSSRYQGGFQPAKPQAQSYIPKPQTLKWDFGKQTKHPSGEHSHGALRIFESNTSDRSVSSRSRAGIPAAAGSSRGGSSSGGQSGGNGSNGDKSQGNGTGPSMIITATTAVFISVYITNKLIQTFGDLKMKIDAALRESAKSKDANPNCKRTNCKSCAIDKIEPVTTIKTASGKTCKTTNPVSLKTRNTIYLIQCKETEKIYVGMTTREAITRLSEHLRDILKEKKKTLPNHFNTLGCFGQFERHLRITPLTSVSDETMRGYSSSEQTRIMQYVEVKIMEVLGEKQLLNKQKKFGGFKFEQPSLDRLFSVQANGVYVDEKQVLTFSN